MSEVTIGGETRNIGQMSAFKAMMVGDLLTDAEQAVREVLLEMARFKRSYEQEHYTEMGRAEARLAHRPGALWREVPVTNDGEVVKDDDGVVVLAREPVLVDGRPVIGPDPLGHMTEADWEHSGQVLQQHETPAEGYQWAAVVPVAFRLARSTVLRLVALALTPNADLEKWDDQGDEIRDKLDEEAKRLVHRSAADELMAAFVSTLEAAKDQLAGPFGQARAAVGDLLGRSQEGEKEPASSPPPPMTPASDESTSSQTSSTSSGAGTAESPGGTSPTGSPSEPSSVSATA